MTPTNPSSNVTGLLLSDDLMFTSRIVATARDFGFAVTVARTADILVQKARENPPACVLLDLANQTLSIAECVGRLREVSSPFVVAYGSHVDSAGLRAARAAGCDLVMPRRQFVEELAKSLPRWFVRNESAGRVDDEPKTGTQGSCPL